MLKCRTYFESIVEMGAARLQFSCYLTPSAAPSAAGVDAVVTHSVLLEEEREEMNTLANIDLNVA